MSKININNGWTFIDKGVSTAVTIPHSVKIENIDVAMPYQGEFLYTRNLDDVLPKNKEVRVFLEFEGVMTNAKVFINDIRVCEHFGGYLPIYADITDYISKNNVLRVEVENYDDPTTPPGKKTQGLDFLYYGGIYREVNIYIKPKVYITNAVENYDCGGGIKLQSYKRKDGEYELKSTVVIKNKSETENKCDIKIAIYDKNNLVANGSIKSTVKANHEKSLTILTDCKKIIEWDVNNPYRYRVVVSVNDYCEEVMFGFRTAMVDKNGFFLNGNLIKLFGVNRHDLYPYIGIGASNEAERREARMLKETGINVLRLAHYPQSPTFLDECDNVGLLVIDCVPGWQYRGGKVWQKRLLQCVSEMVRRDRNHASVIMYEVTPNETHWATRRGDAYYVKLREAAKKELDNCIVSGDTAGRRDANHVNLDVPYSGEDRLSRKRKLFPNGERKFLKREYGDWGFGGNNSTSRASIGDGEYPMTVQAFNFQWDRNNTYGNENILGDLIWEGIDHNRGYFPKKATSTSGIFDIFRRKKFSYYWVKSQNKPLKGEYTLFPSINECCGVKNFLVYSNCKTVAIYIDGKQVASKGCDDGESHYFDRANKNEIVDDYWAMGVDHIAMSIKDCPLAKHAKMRLYQGGDCKNLEYPPFTFNNIDLSANNMTVVGYDDKNIKVAEYTKVAYSEAVALEIAIEDYAIPLTASDNDFVWLRVKAIDKNGDVDYKFSELITLEISGGATIYTTKMKAEAGVASFMLKGNSAKITIKAMAEKLSIETVIDCKIR